MGNAWAVYARADGDLVARDWMGFGWLVLVLVFVTFVVFVVFVAELRNKKHTRMQECENTTDNMDASLCM